MSRNEGDLLAAKVNSKNVVRILGYFTRIINNDQKYNWFISEYLELTLNDDRILNGDINVLRNVALDILNAVKDIHSKKIVHLDVFPRNIGGKVDQNGNIVFKLFDFGLAKELEIQNEFNFASRHDIACIGLILNVLSLAMKKVKKDTSNMKDSLADFILILTYNVEFPLSSIEEALLHPFVSGEPFNNIPDKYGKRILLIK